MQVSRSFQKPWVSPVLTTEYAQWNGSECVESKPLEDQTVLFLFCFPWYLP